MKITLVLLVSGLCALALSTPVQQKGYKVADKVFLKKQKDVLTLFYQIQQPSYNQEYVDIANNFKFEDYASYYTNQEVYKNFYQYYKYNSFLPKGAIFSVFYQEHVEQAEALFKLFYYAKDYETFFKTAVWARQYFNEGLFLYSYSVAVVYRPDTYGIILPPIYEVYPQYFFNTEVIHEAQRYKQVYQGEKQTNKYYTVQSNYSGYYLNLHPEQSLSYFLEDVGINSFYYYYNLYYPYWLNGDEFKLQKENRGELFFYVYQQIIARYYLERLSNGFGEIPFFNWEVPFETSYYPSLQYPNGLEFPSRPKFAHLYEYFYNYGQSWSFKSKYGYSYSFVQDYERRIRDAIASGHAFNKDGEFVSFYNKDDVYYKQGFNTFGGLIASYYPESPNTKYYGNYEAFARHLLGYSYQPYDQNKVAPSALEHFETSLRDPAFYQFYKRIVLFSQKYKANLPAYTEKDLVFPGVEVEKVEFDRLITFFDTFDSEITNAVYVTPEEYTSHPFGVRARQYRLNHKPFTYSVQVKSDKDVKAVVKIYLGPKYDEYGRYINITENRLNFVEFDHFVYELKSGENTIKRNSYDSVFYKPDRTSYHQLYEQVNAALKGGEEFHVDGSQNYFSFPQRFLIPKGSENGVAYQFYVFVAPYVPYQHQDPVGEYFYPQIGSAAQYIDGYPLGYPFDRFIKYEQLFYNVPNSYFYEAKIYHKHVNDVQGVH